VTHNRILADWDFLTFREPNKPPNTCRMVISFLSPFSFLKGLHRFSHEAAAQKSPSLVYHNRTISVCVYIYIYTHIYTHTHAHTQSSATINSELWYCKCAFACRIPWSLISLNNRNECRFWAMKNYHYSSVHRCIWNRSVNMSMCYNYKGVLI